MTWTWRLEDTDGSVVIGPASPIHPSQADAESWIGEQWRDLSAAGVTQVTLFDGAKRVYGPMALSE